MRVVHFINQFFAGFGGEEQADTPYGVFEGQKGPAAALQKELPADATVIATMYCGDNFASEHEDAFLAGALKTLEELKPDVIVAGPAFNAGRYGMACGTVSSVATEIEKELPVSYIGVVKPAASRASEVTRNGKIGVIGTAATIASGSYKKELCAINPSFSVTARSCPLFVPLVEAGFVESGEPITTLAAERYLKDFADEKVDTLILGCTHYPIISGIIKKILGPDVTLINAGHTAATAAAALLIEKNLLGEKSGNGDRRFFVSDMTQGFTDVSSILLGRRFPMDIRVVGDVDTY